MASYEAAFDFLLAGDHEMVIYGNLKRLHIVPRDNRYDDFLQEARLLFIKAYQTFPQDPTSYPHQFLAYANTKIHWGLVDQLRRDQRGMALTTPDDSETLSELSQPDLDLDWRINESDVIKTVLKRCSDAEQRYLLGILRGRSVAEIAHQYRVSRGTVYQWRHRVARKMHDVLQKDFHVG
ncbi:sigma-70 family RNA polymerase sigma factor [Levilactobacillus bambusae]|uniref:RNA polymerase subunit sigma-24 n=1 Tax=Levilactobacillus bambusae TaxID=2024736 RepID=A0A2V1MYB4_9LACO|nr:sigma-70 family RNA polymerase sigma factor [Levilactobacillus bambusae]PWF99762.1 RNA polymerase subunit sigma-24 [Levilactobacillus bambusae]